MLVIFARVDEVWNEVDEGVKSVSWRALDGTIAGVVKVETRFDEGVTESGAVNATDMSTVAHDEEEGRKPKSKGTRIQRKRRACARVCVYGCTVICAKWS